MSDTLPPPSSDGTRGPSPSSSSTDARPVAHLIILYNFFYVFGIISLTAVFLTAWLSPRIKRASTWFLFIFSWILTCITNLMLLGRQTGPLPDPGLCLGQAMLIYAVPVFSSFTTLAFILHMYLLILSALRGRVSLLTNYVIFSLHLGPWVFLLGICLLILAMGIVDPTIVERDASGMYCHLTNSMPSKLDAVLVMIAMAILIVLEVLIFIHLRRSWKATGRFRDLRGPGDVSIDALVRVGIFSFLPMLSLGISALNFLPVQKNPVQQYSKTNIVVAMLPTAAGLIFGSQRDVLRVWTFRPGSGYPSGSRSQALPSTSAMSVSGSTSTQGNDGHGGCAERNV